MSSFLPTCFPSPPTPISVWVAWNLTIFISQRPGMVSSFCSGPSSEPHAQSIGCKEGGFSCFISQPLSLTLCGLGNFSVAPAACTPLPPYFRQGAMRLAHKIWTVIAWCMLCQHGLDTAHQASSLRSTFPISPPGCTSYVV